MSNYRVRAPSSIISYELENNVILKSILSNGIFASRSFGMQADAVLVPRQSSLSPLGIVSCLLDSGVGSRSEDNGSVNMLGRLTGEDEDCGAASVLWNFLLYHIINFSGTSPQQFTTHHGHRGEFSPTLGEVRRIDATVNAHVCGDAGDVKWDLGSVPSQHFPSKLQFIIIDGPLMELSEIEEVLGPIFKRQCGETVGGDTCGDASPLIGSVVGGVHYSQEYPSTAGDSSPFVVGTVILVADEDEDMRVDTNLSPYVSRRQERQPQDRSGQSARSHQYTKESIADYRRVVAVDNDIQYSTFQSTIGSPLLSSVAKRVSLFVEKWQHAGQSQMPLDCLSKFMRACRNDLQRYPSVAHLITILLEGIEKFVTTKLYCRLYETSTEETELASALQEKWKCGAECSAENLDALPEVDQHYLWGQAMFELDGMNFFKSPRDKLRCGMRACELLGVAIGDVLRARNAKAKQLELPQGDAIVSPQRNSFFGADEFFPCLVFLVLRAEPYSFYQNMRYIEKYRNPMLITSEENYCFSTLQAAMQFWLNSDAEGNAQAPLVASVNGMQMESIKDEASMPVPNRNFTEVPPHVLSQETDMLPSLRQISNNSHKDSGVISTQEQSAQTASFVDSFFSWTSRVTTGKTTSTPPTALPAPPLPSSTPLGFFSRLTQVSPEAKKELGLPRAGPHVTETMSATRRLLKHENKMFNDLTITELRDIVEEARRLVQ